MFQKNVTIIIMKKRKFTKEELKSAKNKIKQYFTLEGYTVAEVAQQVNLKYPNASSSGDNLNSKINNGTLRIIEEREIADILGYDVVWVKRDN